MSKKKQTNKQTNNKNKNKKQKQTKKKHPTEFYQYASSTFA